MRRSWTGLALAGVAVAGLAGCSGSAPDPVGVTSSAETVASFENARSFEIRSVTDAVPQAEMPPGAKCPAKPLPSTDGGWICDDATQTAYLAQPAALVASDVKAAEAHKSVASAPDSWSVYLTFTDAGALVVHVATEVASQSTPPADVLLMIMDGNVISAPHVVEAVDGARLIVVVASEAAADALVAATTG